MFVFYYKIHIHRLSGQYRIEQQEQGKRHRGISAATDNKGAVGYMFFPLHQAVHDHQYHKRNTGEIVVDESDPGDKEPGQVLRQVADCQKSSCCIFSVGQGNCSICGALCFCVSCQRTEKRIIAN